MISGFISYLENLVLQFGPMGVFIASFIEEFIAPIPSSIVILSAGYGLMGSVAVTLAHIGYLYMSVALPVSLGLTLGSLIWYGAAYFFGEPFLRRFGKYIGLSWRDIERAHNKLTQSKKDEWVLFTLRCIPVVPSIAINVVAGLMKMSFWPYTIITILGVSIRAMILGFAGWQLGNVYREYGHVLDRFEDAVLYGLIVGCIIFILYRIYKKKYTTP